MKSAKEFIHAFIVRIWIEPREVKGAEPIWRGVIEHVDDKKPEDKNLVPFDRLDILRTYFAKYLGNFGIKTDTYDK